MYVSRGFSFKQTLDTSESLVVIWLDYRKNKKLTYVKERMTKNDGIFHFLTFYLKAIGMNDKVDISIVQPDETEGKRHWETQLLTLSASHDGGQRKQNRKHQRSFFRCGRQSLLAFIIYFSEYYGWILFIIWVLGR